MKSPFYVHPSIAHIICCCKKKIKRECFLNYRFQRNNIRRHSRPALQMTRNLEGLKRERGLAVESGARLSIAQLTEVFDKIHGTPTLRPAIIQQLSISGRETTIDIMVGPGEPAPAQREALTTIARQYPTVRMDVKNANAAPALIVRLSVGSRL